MEISDSCLRINGFLDPWLVEKRAENTASIEQFRDRLDVIDRLSGKELWLELFRGVFAGNIFDWGALVVAQILENELSYGLKNALKHIQPRPWLIDGMDGWLERIEVIDYYNSPLRSGFESSTFSNLLTTYSQGPAHKCALIFVDNSGADFILGIMPFARQLLIRGTKIILCANRDPSINDITFTEVQDVIRRCCEECTVIKKAYNLDQLLVCQSGQPSVCLDLRCISSGKYFSQPVSPI